MATSESMTPHKVKVTDVNPHIICVLCGGYFIDATTITECLHTFCRPCIVWYLESSQYCPICDTQAHDHTPLLGLRPDYILQDLVFKLVPGLINKEVTRRKEFYYQHCPPDVATCPDLLEHSIHRQLTHGELFYTEEENISLCLEFSANGKVKDTRQEKDTNNNSLKNLGKRYLLCPARFTIQLVKKFIRNKFDLPSVYNIDVFHTKDSLKDDYSLMDVAYIYTWRKTEPLHLFYSVYEPKPRPSLPVHIRLPAGLVRRGRLVTSSVTSRLARGDSADDNKDHVAGQIRMFAERRSRVFGSGRLPASISTTATRHRGTLPDGTPIKQEPVSDEELSPVHTSPPSVNPSPRRPSKRPHPLTPAPLPPRPRGRPPKYPNRPRGRPPKNPVRPRGRPPKNPPRPRGRPRKYPVAQTYHTDKPQTYGSLGAQSQTREYGSCPTRGAPYADRSARYVVRGYRLTAARRRRHSASSQPSSSSDPPTDSSTTPSSSSLSSSSPSPSLDLYSFQEDDDCRPLAPKIIRRRYSDSSWSSNM